jgi:hypothetical protein
MWRIDPLLGKDLETNKTFVAMQRRSKHASTIIQLLLVTVLGSYNSWPTTMETGVFYVVRANELSLRQLGDPVSCHSQLNVSLWRKEWEVGVKWPPVWVLVESCNLWVEFRTGGCEDKTWAREAEESPMLEAVARKRLKTQQAGKRISGCCVHL